MKVLATLSRHESRYFEWLCDIVSHRKASEVKDYYPMLLFIFQEPFISIIPNDDNRALDGIALRDRFQNETGYSLMADKYYYKACSVLEMMIALSQRMAWETFNPAYGGDPDAAKAFWQLVKNLNLKPNHPENKLIIKGLIERNYMENGLGGLFPLNYPHGDQTKIEIWYQMMHYIYEQE